MKSLAAVIVVLNDKGKILLLKRRPGSYWMANKWGLPGGIIEENETNTEGASRETFEETGLMINPSSLKLLSLNKKVAIYFTKAYNEAIKIDHEHTDWAWVERQELTTYDTIPDMGELFDMALNYDKE